LLSPSLLNHSPLFVIPFLPPTSSLLQSHSPRPSLGSPSSWTFFFYPFSCHPSPFMSSPLPHPHLPCFASLPPLLVLKQPGMSA
jgi:hypothetical protein